MYYDKEYTSRCKDQIIFTVILDEMVHFSTCASNFTELRSTTFEKMHDLIRPIMDYAHTGISTDIEMAKIIR